MSAIGDDIHWETVVLEDVTEVQLGCLFGSDVRARRAKPSHFREPVYTDINRVEPLRRGKFDYEVHGNRLPRTSRNWERMKLAVKSVAGRLVPRACVAGIDVFVDELSHTGPIIVSGN